MSAFSTLVENADTLENTRCKDGLAFYYAYNFDYLKVIGHLRLKSLLRVFGISNCCWLIKMENAF